MADKVANQYELSTTPSEVISRLKFAPKTPTRLLVSSWDKNVYYYDIAVNGENNGTLLQTLEHEAPVLDVCWGADDETCFTGGLDWDVRRINLQTNERTLLSSHEKPVSALAYDPNNNLLISGSWDNTIHIHVLSNPEFTPAVIPLPGKVFSLSLSPTKLVVAMSNRHIWVYDLKSLQMFCSHPDPNTDAPGVLPLEPMQKRESSMKFMTRAVACTPNDTGYATSSIEGRIAVDWFDESPEVQKTKYAFKCHRLTEDGVDVVYPVNSLIFHPVHTMTFASGGGDGNVSLWDGTAKRRIRQYQRFGSSVQSLAFSCDGKFLAVALSPGFEDGKEDPEGKVSIVIREIAESEVIGKKKG